MAIRPYAGGGAQAFQGDNQPLYVQNQNELKKAFNQVQASSISGAAPIGSVIMWAGTSANAPSTYAVCNGASLPTTGTYAALFAVIGYRYGGSGLNFNLPDFHSTLNNPTGSVPVGISANATVPSTKTTSAASAVDAHTHTVSGTINASGQPNAGLGLSVSDINTPSVAANRQASTALGLGINAGNANTHTHSGGVLTAGNADAHVHAVIGNSGDTSVNHAHTGNTSGPSTNHSHTYFRPNTGANASTTIQSSNHSHSYTTDNSAGTNHSHGLFFNTQNNTAGVNSTITAPGAPNAGLALAIVSGNADVHTHIGGILTQGNANTHTHAAANLTSATATTINASTPAHTHTTATTQIIFLIRVS